MGERGRKVRVEGEGEGKGRNNLQRKGAVIVDLFYGHICPIRLRMIEDGMAFGWSMRTRPNPI